MRHKIAVLVLALRNHREVTKMSTGEPSALLLSVTLLPRRGVTTLKILYTRRSEASNHEERV